MRSRPGPLLIVLALLAGSTAYAGGVGAASAPRDAAAYACAAATPTPAMDAMASFAEPAAGPSATSPPVIDLTAPLASEPPVLAIRLPGLHRGTRKPEAERVDQTVFGAHRASMMLRSLTVPGWGQASLGRRHAAATFALAEAGVWSAYTAFKVQQVMRTDTYIRTAKLFAGIDLRGRDEEYLRIVGAFTSSDEYNLYVVTRDAANIYMRDPYDPDMAGYWAYIASHSVKGRDAWRWSDLGSFRRYRAERKQAQRAGIRANSMLAVAVGNRILSALHAARNANKPAPAHVAPTSWNFDFAPGAPGERVLFRSGLRARF